MIDMENPYTYEASLNNIQLKVPFEREIGVERVAITLLNDILSHLCKWPGLSAEDISKFDKEEVNKTYYGFRKKLVLSSPDGMILGDARRDSGHIPLYVVIEVKDLSINPDEDVFTGNGAHAVIQKLKNKPSIIEDIIEETGFDLCEGGRACLIKDKWEVELLTNRDTDRAFPIKIMNPSETLVATLHQLDTYLLDCYLAEEVKGVIWTNGLCWKIWTKDALGNIIRDFPIRLDQAQLGYVKNKNVQIDIDPIRFRYLIDKLISFLSTLSTRTDVQSDLA